MGVPESTELESDSGALKITRPSVSDEDQRSEIRDQRTVERNSVRL